MTSLCADILVSAVRQAAFLVAFHDSNSTGFKAQLKMQVSDQTRLV